ncbi:MAG: hypothetical protein AAF958_08625 [Planctomycetota bacterium]
MKALAKAAGDGLGAGSSGDPTHINETIAARHPKIAELTLRRCYGVDDETYQQVCSARQGIAGGPRIGEFDTYSFHYSLRQQGETIGAMTITRPADGKVDCQEFYPELLLSIFRDELVTSCRFVMAAKRHRGYALLRWMTTSVWRDQVSLGCRGAVINSTRDNAGFYRRMGFDSLPGFEFIHPQFQTDSEVLVLRADPAEQPYFRDAFADLDSVIPAKTWARVLERATFQKHQKRINKLTGTILSYAAGSQSRDPHGYRVVDGADATRIGEICVLFPRVATYLNDRTMVLLAYPATLGIQSPGVLIDTYLHPPTFIRAIHLASLEERPVILAAQPLMGADLILRALAAGVPFPKRMLWASGGYGLPESLEDFVRRRLQAAGCQLEVLHCYGTAEVGHSLFVAMERLPSGRPRYRKAAQHVRTRMDEDRSRLEVITDSNSHTLDDIVRQDGEDFEIVPQAKRVCEDVDRELESWTDWQWSRWTGRVARVDGKWVVQCREDVEVPTRHDSAREKPSQREPTGEDSASEEVSGEASADRIEMGFHEFFSGHGGSILTKPEWGIQAIKTSAAPSESARSGKSNA